MMERIWPATGANDEYVPPKSRDDIIADLEDDVLRLMHERNVERLGCDLAEHLRLQAEAERDAYRDALRELVTAQAAIDDAQARFVRYPEMHRFVNRLHAAEQAARALLAGEPS